MVRTGLNARRVAQAGLELADEIGFDQVTATELARRLEVKVPSLYSHIAGTEDLRSRIAVLALEEMADRGAEAVAGRSGKDALTAFADVYRGYALEHPGRFEAARHRLSPEVAAVSAAPRHAQMTRAILRGYRLGEPDETHAVRLLGSLFTGYVTLELAGGFSHSAPDSDVTWVRVLEALDSLLRSWPTQGGNR